MMEYALYARKLNDPFGHRLFVPRTDPGAMSRDRFPTPRDVVAASPKMLEAFFEREPTFAGWLGIASATGDGRCAWEIPCDFSPYSVGRPWIPSLNLFVMSIPPFGDWQRRLAEASSLA